MKPLNIGADPLREYTDPNLGILGGMAAPSALPSARAGSLAGPLPPAPAPMLTMPELTITGAAPRLGGSVALPELTLGGQADRVREAVAGTERGALDLGRFNTTPPTFTAAQLGLTGAPGAVTMPETTFGPPGAVSMPEMTVGPADVALPTTELSKTLNPLQRLEQFQVGALATQQARLQREAAQLGAIADRRRTAQEEALAAEAQGLEAEQEQADLETEAAKEEERIARERARQQRTALEESQGKYRTAQDELDNTKIDVDAAYGGAAGRLFAGLAVALGAFGARMGGGPNYALQIVNDRITRELDGQRAEIEKKKGKVSELGRILERNERLLGDADAARKLTTAQTYQALRRNMAASNAVQAAGPRGAALLADLDQRANAAMSEVNARLEDVSIRRQGLPLEAGAQRFIAQQELLRKQREAAAAAARGERAKEQEFKRDIEKIRAKGEEDRATKATEILLEQGGAGAIGAEGAPAGGPPTKAEQAVAKGQETLVAGIEKLGVKQPVALRSALDNLDNLLTNYEEQFSGVGGALSRGAQGALPVSLQGAGYKAFEQGILQAFLPYKVAMTGANAPEKEMQQIEAAMGTRDPKLLRAWVNQQRDQLRRAEDTAALAVPERLRVPVVQSFRTAIGPAVAPPSFKPYQGPAK